MSIEILETGFVRKSAGENDVKRVHDAGDKPA
jgi:hypothetical protein